MLPLFLKKKTLIHAEDIMGHISAPSRCDEYKILHMHSRMNTSHYHTIFCPTFSKQFFMFADRKDDAQRMAKVMANGKILFHGFCSLWRQFFFSQSDFQFSHSNCLFPLLRRDGLYHCDYCSKDLSTSLRIKCAVCPDFDLCLECFSVGAEIKPHASDHAYRVVDNLSFPVYTLDWGADEELLLLEGVEFFGLGNWAKVAEHGGKHADDCKAHYFAVYVETETFPQPKPTSPTR